MSSEWQPFVGQRVRMTEYGRRMFLHFTSYTGVVKKVCQNELKVHRDGLRHPDRYSWALVFWGPIPPCDMSLDETCQQLVAAYLAGDKTAALGLADRIFELQG